MPLRRQVPKSPTQVKKAFVRKNIRNRSQMLDGIAQRLVT